MDLWKNGLYVGSLGIIYYKWSSILPRSKGYLLILNEATVAVTSEKLLGNNNIFIDFCKVCF